MLPVKSLRAEESADVLCIKSLVEIAKSVR
jgi:hypothetical protein